MPLPFFRPLARHTLGSLALACAATLALAAPGEGPAPKVLKKVPPEFPADASANSGTVKARVSIDPQGKVTDVQIVEASPKRMFDRAATNALMGWRFEPSGQPQAYEVKLIFSDAD
jgi:protein TonB